MSQNCVSKNEVPILKFLLNGRHCFQPSLGRMAARQKLCSTSTPEATANATERKMIFLFRD